MSYDNERATKETQEIICSQGYKVFSITLNPAETDTEIPIYADYLKIVSLPCKYSIGVRINSKTNPVITMSRGHVITGMKISRIYVTNNVAVTTNPALTVTFLISNSGLRLESDNESDITEPIFELVNMPLTLIQAGETYYDLTFELKYLNGIAWSVRVTDTGTGAEGRIQISDDDVTWRTPRSVAMTTTNTYCLLGQYQYEVTQTLVTGAPIRRYIRFAYYQGTITDATAAELFRLRW